MAVSSIVSTDLAAAWRPLTEAQVNEYYEVREEFNMYSLRHKLLDRPELWPKEQNPQSELPLSFGAMLSQLHKDPISHYSGFPFADHYSRGCYDDGDVILPGDLLRTKETDAVLYAMRDFVEKDLAEARKRWAQLREEYNAAIKDAIQRRKRDHPEVEEFFVRRSGVHDEEKNAVRAVRASYRASLKQKELEVATAAGIRPRPLKLNTPQEVPQV